LFPHLSQPFTQVNEAKNQASGSLTQVNLRQPKENEGPTHVNEQ